MEFRQRWYQGVYVLHVHDEVINSIQGLKEFTIRLIFQIMDEQILLWLSTKIAKKERFNVWNGFISTSTCYVKRNPETSRSFFFYHLWMGIIHTSIHTWDPSIRIHPFKATIHGWKWHWGNYIFYFIKFSLAHTANKRLQSIEFPVLARFTIISLMMNDVLYFYGGCLLLLHMCSSFSCPFVF